MNGFKKTIKKSNEKGITLVALVVTIIVMLILAGVTLSYMLDDNKGLFVRTKNATTSYDKGSWQDRLDLYVQETILGHSGVITLDAYIEIVKEETGITDADVNKIDDNNAYITVGDGFKFLVTLVDESRINVTYQGEIDSSEIKPGTNADLKIKYTAIATSETPKVTAEFLSFGSGVNEQNVKWKLTQSTSAIGTSDDSYSGTIPMTSKSITLDLSAGANYLHVLLENEDGSKTEAIDRTITVKTIPHIHEGSSENGGGCYTQPVYHTHNSSCYKTVTVQGKHHYTTFEYIGTTSKKWTCEYCQETCTVSANEHEDAWEDGECPKNIKEEQELICNKDTTTIESYELTCGKTYDSFTIEGIEN